MTKLSTTSIARVRRAMTDFDVNTSQHLVEGIAVPFDTLTRVSDDGVEWYLEEWARRAFDRQLKHEANIGRVKFVALHDEGLWIGKSLALRASAEGLVGAWKVDRTTVAEAWLYKIADGQLPGLSIQARIYRDERPRPGHRRRTEAWLEHVSGVEVPAFAGALVTAVRASAKQASRVARRDHWAAVVQSARNA